MCYLNTSNVTVNLRPFHILLTVFSDLNTSNVTVNLCKWLENKLKEKYLNTSNVTVNQVYHDNF